VKNNEIWNNDHRKEKKENLKNNNNENIMNESSNNQSNNHIEKTVNENQFQKFKEKSERNKYKIEIIKRNSNQKSNKDDKIHNEIGIIVKNTSSNIDIRNLKMGYCDIIKGYILSFKIFKKKNYLVVKKYTEFSKYECNLTSLIDYSNLIKMMIKVRMMIDRLIKHEN